MYMRAHSEFKFQGVTCWLGCADACAGVLAKPVPEARGHTGYLTFARRLVEEGGAPAPAWADAQGGDAAGE